MSGAPTEDQVLEALARIQDPDLNRNIVELGFVKELRIDGARVSFTIELTTPACPVKDRMESEARTLVSALPGVESVEVRMTADTRGRDRARSNVLPGVRNPIAVASGKGGVGKSTTAVNLALALAESGASVGLLDCDIYGPSVPLMLGLHGTPEVRGQALIPMERFGLRVMSIGFLSTDRTPVVWRGPMVHQVVQQFLTQVEWGDLDYLVMDLPPGTGDTQLTLTQTAPLSGAVIVTTPQEVALLDAVKGLEMFNKVNVPVLGMVENMSYFQAPGSEEKHYIFGQDGGKKKAVELEVPFLGEVPILPEIREGGDSGRPVVVDKPDSPAAEAYRAIAGRVAQRLAVLNVEPAPNAASIQWVDDFGAS